MSFDLVYRYHRIRGAFVLMVAGSSETLIPMYQATWRHSAEDSKLHSHRRETLDLKNVKC